MWNTNSKMAIIGFPVSNPVVPYKERKGGLDFLFKTISLIAELDGYGLLWTTSATESVIESLTKTGWKEADTNVNQYVKTLF